MSDVDRMVDLADADLLDIVGPVGSPQWNAAMALAIRSAREGSRNARDGLERSGTFRTLPATAASQQS